MQNAAVRNKAYGKHRGIPAGLNFRAMQPEALFSLLI